MPAYNVASYVEEAANSVAAQSWADVHLVAVDDGSTDGTAGILDRLARTWTAPGPKLTLVRQPNTGAAAARNAGLARASGAFVAFLDADDRWYPELLARLVATLDAAPDLDMTFPRYRYVDAAGHPIGVVSRVDRARCSAVDLMVANPVHSATGVLMRTGAARRVGAFDETLTACIDLDFWVRVAALRPGNIGPTDAVLADYRKREGQITGSWRRVEENWARVCDKMQRAGKGLSPDEFRRARARHCLFWSTIAYSTGDYAAARRLIAETWRRDPAYAAAEPLARIRTLSAAASVLPARPHAALRHWFNARRASLR